jgi:hypothetical protein
MLLAAIALLMDRIGLFFLSILILFVASLVLIAVSRPVFIADAAEDVRNIDDSEPLRLKDFLSSWRSIVKLEKKYGVYKSLAIHLLLMLGLYGLSMVIIYWVMLDAIPTLHVRGLYFTLPPFTGAFIGSFIAFIMNYRSVRNRVKKQQAAHTACSVVTPYAVLAGEQKFCAACGTPNCKDARYCTICGNKFLE